MDVHVVRIFKVDEDSWLRRLPHGKVSNYVKLIVNEHLDKLRQQLTVLMTRHSRDAVVGFVQAGQEPLARGVQLTLDLMVEERPIVKALWEEVSVSGLNAADLVDWLLAGRHA
jgi:hypothetical protein